MRDRSSHGKRSPVAGPEGREPSRGAEIDLPGLPSRYRVQGRLGEGLHKRVFLAADTLLDRRVAIAKVELRGATEPALRRLHEARAMARVGDSPHTVAIYDVIEQPDAAYIVSQYLPGGDLATLLCEGRLPLAGALRTAIQICLALEHAHDRDLAHGDIKPSNVLLDERGAAHLGDFGLARDVAEAPGDTHGSVAGTPDYMAPELARGSPARASSDLYALGCLLYELVTGAPPFRGATASETLRLHESACFVPPRERCPELPATLEDLIGKLMSRRPEDRPASCRDVRAALEGILSAGFPQSAARARARNVEEEREVGRERPPERQPAPLVGRAGELAQIGRAVERGLAGEPGLVLVSADPGMGKSRLLAELRARVESRGGVALFGQGYEDVRLPYRPFVEALLPMTGRLSELSPEHADRLRALLYLEPSALDEDSPAQRDAHRHPLFLALLSALVAWSEQRCLALVIDDLHWVDSASFDVFEHLAFGLAQAATRAELRVILAAGFRPGEPEARLSRSMARLQREGICQILEPEGLDDLGIHERLVGLGIDQPSDQLVYTVREATQGNPLFVREVLACLERQGALLERGGAIVSSVAASELAMTSSLTSAIAERRRDLSEPCRRLLVLGAILGTRFDVSALAALASHSEDDLVDTLDEAVAQRLLVDEGQHYRFAHPLAREVFYAEASASRRQRVHLRIARRLQEEHAQRPEAGAIEVASHMLRAGKLAEPEEAARLADRGADRALADFAWHEAAQLLEDALAVGGARLPARARAELHCKAGAAHFGNSDFGPCLHHLDAAVEGFRSADDVEGLVQALAQRGRAAMQFGLVPMGELGDVAPLEAALERLGAGAVGCRARALGTLAQSYWLARQTERAEQLAREALSLAEAEHDERMCSELSFQLALSQFQQLRVGDALDSWRRAVVHARRSNDLLEVERCQHRIAFGLYLSGQLEASEQAAQEAQRLNERVRNPSDASVSLATLVGLAVLRGDFEAAERHAREALPLIRRSKYPWSGALLLPALACGRALQGDWSGANQAIDLLLEPGTVFDDPGPLEETANLYRQLIDVYAGEAPPAVSGRGAVAAGDSTDPSLLPRMCAHVEIAAAGGAPELLEAAGPLLALCAQRDLAVPVGWPFLLPRIRGLHAQLEGRFDEAQRGFERAVELGGAIGAEPEAARARLELAALLARRGTQPDRSCALAHLHAALPTLERLGPSVFRDRASKLVSFLEDQPD